MPASRRRGAHTEARLPGVGDRGQRAEHRLDRRCARLAGAHHLSAQQPLPPPRALRGRPPLARTRDRRCARGDPRPRDLLTALLSQSRRFQAGSIAVPASRFLCEHLHQKLLFWACISRIHAQVPVVTTGKLTHTLRQQIPCGIDIPIVASPALGTRPLSLIEPQLIEREPAHRAVPARGIPPVDFQEQWAIPVTLVPELPSQFAECGVPYRTGSSPTRETPHIQVFNGDDIKFLHQTSRQSMQRVLAFFSRPRMSTRNSQPLLLTPLAPLLA